jgi:hypothetical protein
MKNYCLAFCLLFFISCDSRYKHTGKAYYEGEDVSDVASIIVPQVLPVLTVNKIILSPTLLRSF